MVTTPEQLLKDKHIHYLYSGGDLVVHCWNPEHEDNNPSLRIDKLTGKFHCFSCGFSGNIFSYFGIYRNLQDVKIKLLKEKIETKLSENGLFIPITAEYFSEDYRNISAETYKHFEVFTLFNDKDWHGRLVFPIRDISGDIVAFIGRRWLTEQGVKYLIRPKHVKLPLYNLDKVSPIKDSIILVEGVFDVLNLYDKGLPNVVAGLGVNLTSKKDSNNRKIKEKFTPLKLLGANKLFIMLDPDDAGRKGAAQIEKALKNMFIVEIIELEDKDPGELTLEEVKKLKEELYGKFY